MKKNKFQILADDIEFIKQSLNAFTSYDLAKDIAERMKALGLSHNALAARAHVSHTMVGKWLNKGAKPHGKERLKELGMALGMDETQLNAFLKRNCYPMLYAKNPLDAACRFVLSTSVGNENIVEIYRKFLKFYRLDAYVLNREPSDIATTVVSQAFNAIKSISSFECWLKQNDKHFRALDRSYIAHAQLIRFVILYLSDHNINDLYITGELPVAIKNLLYPLLADREVAVKGLRSKLIVFGLYENMTEDEIDIMLNMAKLRSITEPLAVIDHVILMALRCAHERYPYFELNNAEKVLKSLDRNENPALHEFYVEQKQRAEQYIHYHDKGGQKTMDRLFEETYTDYAGRGLIHYMKDIFSVLIKNDILIKSETKEYTTLMRTY